MTSAGKALRAAQRSDFLEVLDYVKERTPEHPNPALVARNILNAVDKDINYEGTDRFLMQWSLKWDENGKVRLWKTYI